MSTLLAQARLAACRHWPFASHAILSMVPVPRPGLGTLAVDKHWRLYYDEAALQRMGTESASGVILHELDHLLKRHHKRGERLVGDDNAKWDTWNYATDASINGDLRSQDIPLPDGVIYPEKFSLPEGLSAEEYFRALDQQNESDDEADQESDNNQDTEPEQDADGSEQESDHEQSESDQTPEDSQGSDVSDSDSGSPTDDQGATDPGHEGTSEPTDTDTGDGNNDDQPSEDGNTECDVVPQPAGTSGSCSDGRQRPWELGPPDDDNPGLDQADQEQMIHVTAKNVLEKGIGNGAAGHRVWAEQILDPPVDPASKLLSLVRRCCDVTVGIGERSYRRPSRRNSNPRIVLPSNVAPLPRITVIVDTSGSMDETDLGLSLGMIRKVLNSFRIRDGIKVITGDAKGQTKQICLSDPRRIELTGGGGTNMAKIVAEVLDERPKPQMILVCTDGWTPWPKEDPGIPIVACLSSTVDSLPDIYTPQSWISIVELK